MLQEGLSYLCLFAVRYRRQITQCLWVYPTFSRVEQQLRKYPAFRSHDQFVTAYISAPFVAHMTKWRKGNPFYLGILRWLNEEMRIKLEASASSSRNGKEQDADGDTPMTDMAIIPYMDKNGKWSKAGPTNQVPKNLHAENQIRLLEAWHNDIIQIQAANMERRVIYILERRFNILIREMNQAYLVFQQSKEEGVQHHENNLLHLTQKANLFSINVYQTIIKQDTDNNQKSRAIAAYTEQQVNLEILAQVVSSEHSARVKTTQNIDIWGLEKEKQVEELQEKLNALTERTDAELRGAKYEIEETQRRTIEECQKAMAQIISEQLPTDQGKRIIRWVWAATVTISDKSDDGKKKKTKKKAKAADFFEIPPPLHVQEDKDLLTQTSV